MTEIIAKANGSPKILSSSQQERFQELKSGLSDFLVPTLVSADEWQGFMGREGVQAGEQKPFPHFLPVAVVNPHNPPPLHILSDGKIWNDYIIFRRIQQYKFRENKSPARLSGEKYVPFPEISAS